MTKEDHKEPPRASLPDSPHFRDDEALRQNPGDMVGGGGIQACN
jgi:hypothetical protein